jgi:hypothetical protein
MNNSVQEPNFIRYLSSLVSQSDTCCPSVSKFVIMLQEKQAAVLHLAKDTPLFATLVRAAASEGCFPRRKALLQARIIATGSREVIDSGRMVMLDLHFWSVESEYLSESEPDFSVPVNIPSNWSTQLYLDALSHSVQLHGIISVNTAQAVVGLFNTVNSVHALYQFDLATVQELIGLQQD